MRQFIFFQVLFVILTLSSTSLSAQQQFFTIEKFVTEQNDTIFNCKVGYRTFGEIDNDSGNVIIYPTWFGGTSKNLVSLINPERFIDTSKYFVIAIDALGNGVSSSPSNYNELNKFPSITIYDMVKSQYLLLTRNFGLTKIYGAIGGSMGGMQVFEWAASFPNFIQKAVAYVSTPQPTPNDLLQWYLRKDIIEKFQDLNASENQIQNSLRIISDLIARSPEYLNEKIEFESFEEYIQKYKTQSSTSFTVSNYKCQIEAMLAHDIYRNNRLENYSWSDIKMMFIVSQTDRLVHPVNTIQFAIKNSFEYHVLENNCGHLAIGCELNRCSELIRNFFD
jgi:homoserine O-acetyltransferase